MIVAKNGKYGAINVKAEEIVPCQYDYIHVGKGEMKIWNWDCEWDNALVDTVDKFSVSNKIEITPPDDDLTNGGYIVIGITLEKKKAQEFLSNPQSLSDKLRRIAILTKGSAVNSTTCDVFLPNGEMIAQSKISKFDTLNYMKEEGTLIISDRPNLLSPMKKYGYYVRKSSNSILISDELSNDHTNLSGNSTEGFYDLQKIVITKDVTSVEWNGLGRYNFCKFDVSPENEVFCEKEGVLYTRKGYDRHGKTNKKRMIELVACPTNVKEYVVSPGTIRIANCAFKDSNVEKLSLPDSLEEIGVNAFYLAIQLKELEIPISIRKIESQDVGKSGTPSPTIKYDGHIFKNWEDLYAYMCEHGFEKKNGNVVKTTANEKDA